jgi:hypothetical protein
MRRTGKARVGESSAARYPVLPSSVLLLSVLLLLPGGARADFDMPMAAIENIINGLPKTTEVVQEVSPPGVTPRIFLIFMPNVRQRETEYRNIRFLPGGRVKIEAGGCAQTGSTFPPSATWKRYVNPIDGNGNPFPGHYGQIGITGMINGLQRIMDYNGKTLDIPKTGVNPDQLFLRLGYFDTNYGDNGYWGRITPLGVPDDGPKMQCFGQREAYVVVRAWAPAVTLKSLGAVTLKAQSNGKFVCAENVGTRPLIANRDAAGPWETFELFDAGPNRVVLKAGANGRFVRVDPLKMFALVADRDAAGPSETFEKVDMGGGKIALKSMGNNLFVAADPGGKMPLYANRPSPGPWETFTLAGGGQSGAVLGVHPGLQPVTQPAVVAGTMPGTTPVQGTVASGKTVACAPKITITTRIDDGWVKATYGPSAMTINQNIIDMFVSSSNTTARLTERDVQIEILFCGICHSDLHYARDEWHDVMPTVYPCVPGHEIVGRVARVGSAVTKFKPGDLAGVGCLVDSDGTCPQCQAGLEQFCPNMVLTYNSPDKHLGGVTYGGYSDSIVVDERFVLRVPETSTRRGRAAAVRRDHDLLADAPLGRRRRARRSAWSASAGWATWREVRPCARRPRRRLHHLARKEGGRAAPRRRRGRRLPQRRRDEEARRQLRLHPRHRLRRSRHQRLHQPARRDGNLTLVGAPEKPLPSPPSD